MSTINFGSAFTATPPRTGVKFGSSPTVALSQTDLRLLTEGYPRSADTRPVDALMLFYYAINVQGQSSPSANDVLGLLGATYTLSQVEALRSALDPLTDTRPPLVRNMGEGRYRLTLQGEQVAAAILAKAQEARPTERRNDVLLGLAEEQDGTAARLLQEIAVVQAV